MKAASMCLKRGDTWLCLLAWLVAVALWMRHAPGAVTATAWVVASAYTCVLRMSPAGSRWRLFAGYGLVLAGYLGSSAVVEALGIPVESGRLLSLDRALFGETPAVTISAFRPAWLGEVLSAGYLTYLIYLHVVLCCLLVADVESRARWTHVLWGAFAVGIAGYLLCPASSPNRAHPQLFALPVAGGAITRLNESLNAVAAARYDAFPSLHVLITLAMLRMDLGENRRRFWGMLGPSAVMIFSTLALRLHYAVDLLASAALFGLLCLYWRHVPINCAAP